MKNFLKLTIILISMYFTTEAQTTNLGIGSGTGGTSNVFIGKDAGKVSTGNFNTNVGFSSGMANTSGFNNSFLGYFSGKKNTSGSSNTLIGFRSGNEITTTSNNTFIGSFTGFSSTSGSFNNYFGYVAGYSNISGLNNIMIGAYSGYSNTTGSNNLCIGNKAGNNNVTGSGNVFIGNNSGFSELGSNKLYIDNSNTAAPLIWGDFNSDRLVFNGKVGIGTSAFPTSVGGVSIPAYQLFVKGGILTEEVRVRSGWADYVFNDDYNLIPLSELNNYISKNKHLPGVPTSNEVENNGLSLGEIAKIQQEKIEELTLYLIKQNEKIEELNNRLNKIEKENTK